jgi:hypothetical protein
VSAMRLSSLLALALVAGAVTACDEAPTAPLKPTYVDDVEPILRGNCFHCHGADRSAFGAFRWDFYDPLDPTVMALGNFSMEFALGGTKAHSLLFNSFITNKDENMRMPPPPATRLSEQDLLTVQRWIKDPVRGTRRRNHKPAADWLARPATVAVSDADFEQVLGKVSCNGRETPVLSVGTTRLVAGSQPPCIVTIFDGQDAVNVQLN